MGRVKGVEKGYSSLVRCVEAWLELRLLPWLWLTHHSWQCQSQSQSQSQCQSQCTIWSWHVEAIFLAGHGGQQLDNNCVHKINTSCYSSHQEGKGPYCRSWRSLFLAPPILHVHDGHCLLAIAIVWTLSARRVSCFLADSCSWSAIFVKMQKWCWHHRLIQSRELSLFLNQIGWWWSWSPSVLLCNRASRSLGWRWEMTGPKAAPEVTHWSKIYRSVSGS